MAVAEVEGAAVAGGVATAGRGTYVWGGASDGSNMQGIECWG
jgi:hypothetical protein